LQQNYLHKKSIKHKLGPLTRKSKAVFASLIAKTKKNLNHHFDQIKKKILRTGSNWDYEDLKPYVEKVVNGEEYPLKGKPLYKTSGTTSGAKYIP
jgi:phenylalanyl-tRNA synthetase alpha subunit